MLSRANVSYTDSENQKFTLLNSSTQYLKELQKLQNSYDSMPSNQIEEDVSNSNEFELLIEKYANFYSTSGIITFETKSSIQKMKKLISILSDAGIEVQGIRLNPDKTAIELGFQNEDLKYKAILIMEAIGL